MIVRRRTWTYRLSGQDFARTISFDMPLTAQKARESLIRTFGTAPLEIWGNTTGGGAWQPLPARR